MCVCVVRGRAKSEFFCVYEMAVCVCLCIANFLSHSHSKYFLISCSVASHHPLTPTLLPSHNFLCIFLSVIFSFNTECGVCVCKAGRLSSSSSSTSLWCWRWQWYICGFMHDGNIYRRWWAAVLRAIVDDKKSCAPLHIILLISRQTIGINK